MLSDKKSASRRMKILAIETSCDETAVALLEASGGINPSVSSGPKFKILENLVASQIKIHQPFGGVVPNLAKREHLKNLPILYRQILANSKSEILNSKQIKNKINHKSKFEIKNCDLIAVTVGPGLEPCLWTGINFAQELHKKFLPTGRQAKLKTKIVGASHLEGHLYSSLLNPKKKIQFPAVALIVSGGHTSLIFMKDLTHLKKLGETRDDAAGESFDKVARLLKLPYPGGPEIEKIAKKGDSNAINFPRPMLNQKNYDFSFSGLKTSVLYYLRDNKALISNVAASFQEAAFDVLIKKTLRAVREFGAKTIVVTGGVAANKTLGQMFKKAVKKNKMKIGLVIPEIKFCTDNAAMIAVSAYINYLRNKKYKLIANSNINIS
ncbi:MAG: tRNA (adenosine(37)-N6)-threonylcarbamoyltransferase complex transferase subunit TsaD [Candidatus Paceibacterota bacterium]|jgi:N6-L-threonylcarbamoyladenine synthase